MTILLTLTSMFSSERRSSLFLSLLLVSVSQVCASRVLCYLPRYLDGLLHPLCLHRAGRHHLRRVFLINLPQIEFSAIFFLTDNIKNRTWIITTIDRLTLVLLPATFATMNALYWPYLLNPYSTQFDFELIWDQDLVETILNVMRAMAYSPIPISNLCPATLVERSWSIVEARPPLSHVRFEATSQCTIAVGGIL